MTKCELCPFKGQKKVHAEYNTNIKLIIVGESPGFNEEREGKPFIGANGFLLNRALKKAGLYREECFITNAMLCRPPKDMKPTPTQWHTAIECCKNRVERELQEHSQARIILCLGGRALQSLTGKSKITPWTGALLDYGNFKILPCLHPAAVLRSPSYIPVFNHWISRAAKFVSGYASDTFGTIEIYPNAQAMDLLSHFSVCDSIIGVDVETAGIDPLHAKLLCLGLGCKCGHAVSLNYPLDPIFNDLISGILSDPNIRKGMHNGQHDYICLTNNGFVINNYCFDTLLAHATLAPQISHDLGFVAACETSLPRWKSEFRIESDLKGSEAFTKRPAEELRAYNGRDASATAIIANNMHRKLATFHNGQSLFTEYMQLSGISMLMRQKGVLVDTSKFAEHKERLTKLLTTSREEFEALAPKAELGKAGMSKTLQDLFFNHYGLKPHHLSKETGEPSLDRETLEIYTSTPGVPGKLARLLLNYRKHYKLISTYIDGLPMDENYVVHPTWKIYGTITGRWSCTEPNCQNIPGDKPGRPGLRNLFIARPGKTLVYADYSQLELRICTLQSNDKLFSEWYNNNIDGHTQTAMMVAGNKWNSMDDKTKKNLRSICKGFNYAVIYGAIPETIWRVLTLTNPDVTLKTVIALHKRFYVDHPDIKKWQLDGIEFASKNGYIEERLSGRREVFHDGQIEPNKVHNFPVQGFAGSMVNRAIVGISAELDWSVESILFQVHDEIVLEGPDPIRLAKLLKKHMVQIHEWNGNTMEFPIELAMGPSWSKADCQEVKV